MYSRPLCGGVTNVQVVLQVGMLHAPALTAWILLHVLLRVFRYAKLLLDLSDAVGLGSFRDPKDVVEAIFGEAAEASIVTMQNEIESLCHNIRKQERKRDATAGTSTM